MEEKKDIFDKIMSWSKLKPLEPFYKTHKEALLYLFFGFLTTVVSFVVAGIAKSVMESADFNDTAIATWSTVIAWLVAVLFAYVTNRIWVFDSSAHGFSAIAKEMASFYGGRLFTLLVEELIMWGGYSKLGFNYWLTKITANVIVIILNYVISKLVVFRSKKKE